MVLYVKYKHVNQITDHIKKIKLDKQLIETCAMWLDCLRGCPRVIYSNSEMSSWLYYFIHPPFQLR
jgi:hypothetical protein